jgi:23S rRNA (adenine2030-N6)-methyltransferase
MATAAPPGVKAEALRTDGFGLVARAAARAEPRALVLIDPPFERNDDYKRCLTAASILVRGKPGAALAIWTPLKDLETFDRFLRGLESLYPPSGLVVQARLRPLHDPMRMNGCAMVLIGGPDVAAPAEAAARWIVETLGEAGGAARVEPLGREG